ncbi:hypothetical protein, partial [Xylella fastidiosa]|uniref:hypothetical protein n=1 Tax=Xylella fastidiosa TaxID=2371 RepID=UPI001EEC8A45
IQPGRFISIEGSNTTFKIATITGETTLTLNQVWDGSTTTTADYSILPQEEYTLPIQVGHSAFFYHRQYAAPFVLNYKPAQEYFQMGYLDT